MIKEQEPEGKRPSERVGSSIDRSIDYTPLRFHLNFKGITHLKLRWIFKRWSSEPSSFEFHKPPTVQLIQSKVTHVTLGQCLVGFMKSYKDKYHPTLTNRAIGATLPQLRHLTSQTKDPIHYPIDASSLMRKTAGKLATNTQAVWSFVVTWINPGGLVKLRRENPGCFWWVNLGR